MTDVNGDGKTDLGDKISWTLPGHQHRHRHGHHAGDQRRQGRRGDLPGHHAGARRPDHLHRNDGVRHHPGRRGRRRREQHRDGERQEPGWLARSPRRPSSTSTPVSQISRPAADQVGGGHRRQRRRQDRPGRQDPVVVPGQEHRHDDVSPPRPSPTPRPARRTCPVDDAGAGRLDDLHRDHGVRRSPRPTSTPASSTTRPRRARRTRAARRSPRRRRRPRPRSSRSSALPLTKSAAVTDVNGDGKTNLGDKIQWSFLVKNTGTIDDHDGGDHRRQGRRHDLPGHDAGARRVDDLHGDHAAHVITQADVDAGVVSNTATAAGKSPARRDRHLERLPDRHPDQPGAGPAADQVGRRHRRQRRRQDRPRRQDPVVVPGQEHRHRHADRAGDHGPQGRRDDLPGDHAGARAPRRPARRRRPTSISQADVDAGVVNNTATASAQEPVRGHGHVEQLVDLHRRRADRGPAADQVGGASPT